MAIPMMGYILALIFPIYVNLFKRDVMDTHRDTNINVDVTIDKEESMKQDA